MTRPAFVCGRRSILAGALAAALLAGCAAPMPAPDAGTDATRVTTWRGRFAVSYEQSGDPPRQDSGTGSFVLRRLHGQSGSDRPGPSEDRPGQPESGRPGPSEDDRLTLELYSPLGQTVASASAGADGAAIELADGRRFEAQDPDELTERSFGWRLPLSRLTDWLEGRAAGEARRDAFGRLLQATDANWRVTVTDWDESARPRRLDLDWPVQPVEPPRSIRLKLVVERDR